ncbi:MAG: alpha,alpha-trehalose-phosphate synthase (UDP-forming) [bacterium]
MIEDDKQYTEKLIIVSNRLPIVLNKIDDEWHVKPGSGGLVTAMAPVLKNRGGSWIGWPGAAATEEEIPREILDKTGDEAGYYLKGVYLTQKELDKYYYGFANEVLWPLFHDLQSRCNFEPDYWEAYRMVNHRFAEKISEFASDEDFIWVHDYHLLLAAEELRKLGVKSKKAFFLHIPFPPLDIFLKLPWRFEILNAMLQYDLIGFQTARDRRNFIHCVRRLIEHFRVHGEGQVVGATVENHEIRIGAFPISIDFREFENLAASSQVSDAAWFIHEDLPNRSIMLGVDRLDYTKGIPQRLNAFRKALEMYPEMREKISLVQVVVPSRTEVPEYQQLKEHIDQLVGEINGQFTSSGWVPIHYVFRSLDRIELLAYYRTAEIALITPLKDGMNLVAKEYCASNIEENGVLILSEFAGAAAELREGAVFANPHDIVGTANAIYKAYKMPPEERSERMSKMRNAVRRQDIFRWVDSFLKGAFAEDLSSFPKIRDYMPDELEEDSK